MSSIASIQIVDFVLITLYESKSPLGMEYGAIYGVLVKEFRELDGNPIAVNKLLSTLKTLERENLIYSEMRFSSVTEKERLHYFLSLEGELLIERGGYNQRLKSIKNDERRINLQFWFNIILSITSVLAIWVTWLEYKKNEYINVTNKLLISIKAEQLSEKKQDTSLNYRVRKQKKTK